MLYTVCCRALIILAKVMQLNAILGILITVTMIVGSTLSIKLVELHCLDAILVH